MLSPNRSRRPSVRSRFKSAKPQLVLTQERMSGRLRRMTNPLPIGTLRGALRVSGEYGQWLANQNPNYLTVVSEAADGSWVGLDLKNGATIGAACRTGHAQIGEVPGNRVFAPARFQVTGVKICRPIGFLAAAPTRSRSSSHAVKGSKIAINPRKSNPIPLPAPGVACRNAQLCFEQPNGVLHCEPVEVCTPSATLPRGNFIVRTR